MTYFWTFVIATGALLLWGLTRRDGGYQYPFVAGVMFAGWVLPQVWGLADEAYLPDGAYSRVLLMATLCAAACLLGYIYPSRPMTVMNWRFDTDRLLTASVVLTMIGVFFSLLFDILPQTISQGQMSGLSVALLFFADIMQYGFALAVLLFVRTGSKWALGVAAIGAYFYLQAIVFGGRRATTSEFFFVLVLSYWFARKKSISPLLILLVATVGIVGSFSISDYRSASFDSDGITWEEVTNIEWVGNTKEVFLEGGPEMRTAAYQMSAIEERGTYNYGVYHWNRLVFRYVPAQLLGNDVKQALILNVGGRERAVTLAKHRNDLTYQLYGFEKTLGVTASGLTDAFESFGYLGFIKFFFIALLMSKIYKGAVRGNVTSQLLYMVLIVPAMHTVTHNTSWFFEAMPHMILFFLPALLYARVPLDQPYSQVASSRAAVSHT
jgi:hypothetical protein